MFYCKYQIFFSSIQSINFTHVRWEYWVSLLALFAPACCVILSVASLVCKFTIFIRLFRFLEIENVQTKFFFHTHILILLLALQISGEKVQIIEYKLRYMCCTNNTVIFKTGFISWWLLFKNIKKQSRFDNTKKLILYYSN